MSREAVLGRVRSALKRSAGQAIPPPPDVLLNRTVMTVVQRIASFREALQRLNGKVFEAENWQAAHEYVAGITAGKRAIASAAEVLQTSGIAQLADPSVSVSDADVGITAADFALADTGSLVMLASPQEARLVSLLPPVHVAILLRERILTGLDELLTVLPKPAEQTSSMVLITGPSRTADIEQILVRGVHGPGVIHVVVV